MKLANAPDRPSSLGLAVVMALAGCLADAPVDDADQMKLGDFSTCIYSYPDGQPVPCDRDDAVDADWQPGPQYECISGQGYTYANGLSWEAALWTDFEGHFGATYMVSELPGGIAHGAARLKDYRSDQWDVSVAIHGAAEGGVYLGTIPQTESVVWELRVRAFTVSGEPSFLSMETLRVPTTLYEDQPWFVLEFADNQAGPYWFSSMGRVGSAWVPMDFDANGSDFRLRGTFETLIATQGSGIIPSDSDRALMQWESPC